MSALSLLASGWAWLALGVLLAILEVVAPGFIFLGFAIGAGLTGILLFFWPLGLAGSLLAFAILSGLAYLGLRQMFRLREGQVKVIKGDINRNPKP